VSPSLGPLTTGNTVTLLGGGFLPLLTAVASFTSGAVTSYSSATYLSASEMRVVTPALTPAATYTVRLALNGIDLSPANTSYLVYRTPLGLLPSVRLAHMQRRSEYHGHELVAGIWAARGWHQCIGSRNQLFVGCSGQYVVFCAARLCNRVAGLCKPYALVCAGAAVRRCRCSGRRHESGGPVHLGPVVHLLWFVIRMLSSVS
jgi:hypothetical protein